MRLRIASAPALLATVLVVNGCGPPPPQAPPHQAMKLDSALSGISSACGLSYQTTALARNPAPSLSGLEASASRDADKLASVYAGNPGWLYQGETITTIVDDSISLLGECGLVESRAKLVKLTGQAGGG
jgi:hypothetical protein